MAEVKQLSSTCSAFMKFDLRDNTGRVLRDCFKDIPIAILRLADVKYGEDHGDRNENRTIGELFSRANASTKSEGYVVGILLGFVAQEAFWPELRRVFEGIWIVCKPPSCYV